VNFHDKVPKLAVVLPPELLYTVPLAKMKALEKRLMTTTKRSKLLLAKLTIFKKSDHRNLNSTVVFNTFQHMITCTRVYAVETSHFTKKKYLADEI